MELEKERERGEKDAKAVDFASRAEDAMKSERHEIERLEAELRRKLSEVRPSPPSPPRDALIALPRAHESPPHPPPASYTVSGSAEHRIYVSLLYALRS